MAETQATSGTDKRLIERLFDAGAHLGYVKSRRHPSVKPYLFGQKQRVEIFDLEKTSEALARAVAFVEELGGANKKLLFVGGKPEARRIVRMAASSLAMPYIDGRWIGGILTNFKEIKKRIERLETVVAQRERGELSKYTKHERLLIDREINKLETMYGGLREIRDTLPDALFVIDTKHEAIAIEEAAKLKLPVIGLTNTDCDISLIDYPIPANDSTQKSISFFVTEIAEAYKRGGERGRAQVPEVVKD